ncbi:hypothetical protein HPP92_001360 [Vanilla planifolia]|uniref:Protein kinase domain-containing protein n=1 Tax=Vanilla planifolia TaxID=51239 RepID=A0A835SCJ7_VANPL|nr:hypothetical protein HPP92_001360 [Vanilla planifolia]
MERRRKVLLGMVSVLLFVVFLSAMCFFFRISCTIRRRRRGSGDSPESGDFEHREKEADSEELVVFPGGERFRTQDILDAPGEVVWKSSYGTLYRAAIRLSADESGSGGGGSVSVMLLRFIRPACIGRMEDILPLVQLIGFLQHPNLVPLRALYVGPRGEKLFVHPFYEAGNLAQFLKGNLHTRGNEGTNKWSVIYELTLGIARGLEHLHHGFQRPLIHGNLKSKNVLLDADLQPRLSDIGLHLLLSPAAAQEMLEASTTEGYKAPELIKMRDASMESDIFSFGIVLLEMLTCKDALGCRLLVLKGELPKDFSFAAVNGIKDQKSNKEEALLRCYQLASSCCCPSPALRPDIKLVIRQLKEIGR